jgi:hypothetical protein
MDVGALFAFGRLHGLDDAAFRLLCGLSTQQQEDALANFRPSGRTYNVSKLFMGFVRSRAHRPQGASPAIETTAPAPPALPPPPPKADSEAKDYLLKKLAEMDTKHDADSKEKGDLLKKLADIEKERDDLQGERDNLLDEAAKLQKKASERKTQLRTAAKKQKKCKELRNILRKSRGSRVNQVLATICKKCQRKTEELDFMHACSESASSDVSSSSESDSSV